MWLHIPEKGLYENAVAISNRKALSSLHGKVSINDIVTLIDSHGKSKSGIVIFQKYEINLVDIAVIILIDKGIPSLEPSIRIDSFSQFFKPKRMLLQRTP